MNTETETTEATAADKTRPVSTAEVGLRIGDTVAVNGCACRVTAINEGKGRITLTTIPRKLAEATAAVEAEIERRRLAKIEAGVMKRRAGR